MKPRILELNLGIVPESRNSECLGYDFRLVESDSHSNIPKCLPGGKCYSLFSLSDSYPSLNIPLSAGANWACRTPKMLLNRLYDTLTGIIREERRYPTHPKHEEIYPEYAIVSNGTNGMNKPVKPVDKAVFREIVSLLRHRGIEVLSAQVTATEVD